MKLNHADALSARHPVKTRLSARFSFKAHIQAHILKTLGRVPSPALSRRCTVTTTNMGPNVTEAEIVALAREIAFRMAPDALLDANDVAAMFKVSAGYVTHSLVAAPGFPKAIRLALANGGRSQPRWLRSDIVNYIASHRDGMTKRGGRPRIGLPRSRLSSE